MRARQWAAQRMRALDAPGDAGRVGTAMWVALAAGWLYLAAMPIRTLSQGVEPRAVVISETPATSAREPSPPPPGPSTRVCGPSP